MVRLSSVSANKSGGPGRSRLIRLFKAFSLLLLVAVVFVLFDFAFDLRPSTVQSSYRFQVGDLRPDEVKILRQDNLSIVVLLRSDATVTKLQQSVTDLQDPGSRSSRQPGYASNALRSRQPRYFVSYGIGTDLGCTVIAVPSGLQEVCGSATYDLAGRAIMGANRFRNLPIPDYTFSDNYRTLTIKP